jgi:hypothetical protein
MNSRRFIVAPDTEETTIVTEQLIALEGPMSALGQKRTYAPQQAMSALPPIATAKADMPQRSCLLYPPKRTAGVLQGTGSALSRLEKIRCLGQGGLGFGDQSAHYLSDGWDIFNTSCRLARRQ